MSAWVCKHCKNTFEKEVFPTTSAKANHSRWCKENPKRELYRKKNSNAVQAMNQKRMQDGVAKNQYSKARLLGLPKPVYNRVGNFLGKKHTDVTKQKLREKALSSPHRRVKRKSIEYKGILLDSTWELELAKRLDSLGIAWQRPEPLRWVDKEGCWHHYFPDFYLPNEDLYLDPKNPIVVIAQNEKLQCLMEQYKNIRILESLEECKNFVPD